LRALSLELAGKRRIVHTCPRKLGEQHFGITAIIRQGVFHFTVLSEGKKRLLGHGVDGIRSREHLNVKGI